VGGSLALGLRLVAALHRWRQFILLRRCISVLALLFMVTSLKEGETGCEPGATAGVTARYQPKARTRKAAICPRVTADSGQ